MVERKGLGHPDTICDGIAEHVCVRLCRHYLERFGQILHHNVDKVLLVGGSAEPAFSGGRILEPMEIHVAGRATQTYRGTQIPVHDIAVEASREWMATQLPGLNVDRDMRIVSRLHQGSPQLARLVSANSISALANDTSCGAGFAPLTDLERVVLSVERAFGGDDVRRAHPEIGRDIKVMGIRRHGHIDLTIACAFVDRFVRGVDDYFEKKERARMMALDVAHRTTDLAVDAVLNAADDRESGNVYLTVTGTSAEGGDDGEAGRGNKVSGLITPYRTMTMEAAAGKNPVNHVGKLYAMAATQIAKAIVKDVADVLDADCVLVSRIGTPISDPEIVDIRLARNHGASVEAARAPVTDIVASQLRRFADLRVALLEERLRVF